ncbi:hypothetical protein [Albibacterium indicum]|uniref:hypothetical protein n=1 Tax=Albibacterium indicum TaxID=2292082 RepID=UPI0013001F55|nr:hypothetical protein [Pedobacter indicus]
MLTTISWLQYLQALAILIAGYYSVVILLYYRIEMFSLFQRFKNGKQKGNPFPKNNKVMGAAVYDEDAESIDSDALEFPSLETSEENH